MIDIVFFRNKKDIMQGYAIKTTYKMVNINNNHHEKRQLRLIENFIRSITCKYYQIDLEFDRIKG